MTNPDPAPVEGVALLPEAKLIELEAATKSWEGERIPDDEDIRWPLLAGELRELLRVYRRAPDPRVSALVEALERILRLRPAGDVATATNTRALVQQMEMIAGKALARFKQEPFS